MPQNSKPTCVAIAKVVIIPSPWLSVSSRERSSPGSQAGPLPTEYRWRTISTSMTTKEARYMNAQTLDSGIPVNAASLIAGSRPPKMNHSHLKIISLAMLCIRSVALSSSVPPPSSKRLSRTSRRSVLGEIPMKTWPKILDKLMLSHQLWTMSGVKSGFGREVPGHKIAMT